MQPEVSVFPHTEEQQAIGAVGGESERETLLDQPAGQFSGGGKNKASILGAACGRGRGAGDGLAR
jgi:hypothetical protein